MCRCTGVRQMHSCLCCKRQKFGDDAVVVDLQTTHFGFCPKFSILSTPSSQNCHYSLRRFGSKTKEGYFSLPDEVKRCKSGVQTVDVCCSCRSWVKTVLKYRVYCSMLCLVCKINAILTAEQSQWPVVTRGEEGTNEFKYRTGTRIYLMLFS